MTTHKRNSIGLHYEAQRDRARAAFIEAWGVSAAERRQREIDALPPREWKGRQLYEVRCNGETGRGPHLVNLPPALLWALIDLRAFRCPFHA